MKQGTKHANDYWTALKSMMRIIREHGPRIESVELCHGSDGRWYVDWTIED